MYEVTAAFKSEIVKSHTPIAKAQLLRRGALISDDLPIISGTITDDSTAATRRRASIELAADSQVMALLTKDVPSSTGLWPLGNEMKIWAGVQYNDGTQEMIPQGLFRIAKPVVSDNGAVSVTLDMYDRSRAVSRSKFVVPYTIASGSLYVTEIKKLIQSRLAWLTDADFQTSAGITYLTPTLVFTSDDDPWEMAVNMATSIGCEVFWDNNGICVIRPENQTDYTSPVFSYVDGETMNATEIARDLDDEEAYNGVIITAENTDNVTGPIRGEAWDTDATSPTYYDPSNPTASLYGPVPFFDTSPYVTTNAQCTTAAQAVLSRVRGIIEGCTFSAINNPAHQSGDVITLTHTAVGIDNNYILDSFTLGLGANATMGGTCRKRRVGV